MAFSRARYVTVCQQLLVTGLVSALGLTAAGVMTLDIVSPEAAGQGVAPADGAPAARADRGYVDTRPVTPHVREVPVTAPETVPGNATENGQPSARARSAAPALVDGMPVALVTPAEKVSGYATVGVTWDPGQRVADRDITLQVRTRSGGTWSGWEEVPYHDDHGPDGGQDAGEATGHARPGTDPVVVGRVDAVQLRAATRTGTAPRGLELALIDPGTDTLTRQAPAIDTARLGTGSSSGSTSSTGSTTTGASDAIALSAMKVAPKPLIYSRAQWGANEKLREQTKPDYGTIQTGFIHHTVNANDYTAADVPALIRGIYAYHVVSRGWRDIGYNFLVDRFGRIWEGRYGGVGSPVVGAHTKGYNDVSFAASAIGNFEIAQPPQAVLDAFARLFAWKLSLYDIRATATGLKVKSKVLNAINGHRDVGQTACPGKYLYARLPTVRAEAQKIQDAAQDAPPAQMISPTQPPLPAVAQPKTTTFARSSSLAGDTRPDVVLYAPGQPLSVLQTGGMVGYRAPVSTTIHWSTSTKVVAVGDLTGDGRGDVLTRAPGAKGWLLHKGYGNGHVARSAADSRLRLRSLDTLFSAGDWNRDGRADVLGIDRHNALRLYRGTGTGTFSVGTRIGTGWSRFIATVVPGDLNGDSRNDLLAVDRRHDLYRSYGTGTGHLTTPVRVRSLRGFGVLLGGGDLTGDGIGDLLVRRNSDGTGWILPGAGRGAFGYWMGPYAGLSGLTGLSAAPLTGGGRPDVLGRVGNQLRVVANNDLTNVRATVDSGLTLDADTTAVMNVGDWNGDRIPDVITRHGTGGDRLVLNRGLGGGRLAHGVPMSGGWATITRLAPVGDITGDQRPDLVGCTAAGVWEVFPGNGATGFFAPRRLASVRTYNQMTGSTAARWVPTRSGSAVVSVDGTFVPVAGSAVAGTELRRAGMPAGSYDWIIGPGDVNGDGRADLLARQRSNGTLWLIPGTATGFGQRQFVTGGLGKYRLAG
jgi:hypothetical protein